MNDEQIASHCCDLAKLLMEAAQKWSDGAPGTDLEKIKIITCTQARIAAESAKLITGGDPQKAHQFLVTALADAFGATVQFKNESDDSDSPHTFGGKPIVGHC